MEGIQEFERILAENQKKSIRKNIDLKVIVSVEMKN